eukprot:GDKI01036077.1.p2 GENE.GDKI01036077.1~~GDKI01036077.1.p2  ORF type:complete len:143 (+),score=32.02 GDKI01036077.1:695-1123(+)
MHVAQHTALNVAHTHNKHPRDTPTSHVYTHATYKVHTTNNTQHIFTRSRTHTNVHTRKRTPTTTHTYVDKHTRTSSSARFRVMPMQFRHGGPCEFRMKVRPRRSSLAACDGVKAPVIHITTPAAAPPPSFSKLQALVTVDSQ